MKALVVDDQRSARMILRELLAATPVETIFEAGNVAEATQLLDQHRFDLVFVDLRLSEDVRDRGGLELVERIRRDDTGVPVILSALSDMGEIRAAMRAGAHDYLLKEELCAEVVEGLVASVRERRALESEVINLRSRMAAAELDLGLVGNSNAMAQLRDLIRRVAVSDRPVLVTGPSGAGKELVVRAIHQLGAFPSAPLLDINCGAIPEQLLESQLFGHERGAFSGADKKLPGLLATVGTGTLFLDEIAELPLLQQPKLLRVLEARRFRSVGATTDQLFNGRVVCATHSRLEQLVSERRFREDLFHRLAVLEVRVPALAERLEDVPALVAHFSKDQPRPLRFAPEALAALQAHLWPGNVRQLRNVVDQLAILTDDDPVTRTTVERFLRPSVRSRDAGSLVAQVLDDATLDNKLDALEQMLVTEALRRCEGNKSAAARLLGVHRKVVERRNP